MNTNLPNQKAEQKFGSGLKRSTQFAKSGNLLVYFH
jgi:hypothetical protein